MMFSVVCVILFIEGTLAQLTLSGGGERYPVQVTLPPPPAGSGPEEGERVPF